LHNEETELPYASVHLWTTNYTARYNETCCTELKSYTSILNFLMPLTEEIYILLQSKEYLKHYLIWLMFNKIQEIEIMPIFNATSVSFTDFAIDLQLQQMNIKNDEIIKTNKTFLG
jgi:hypothetical protein